MFRKVLQKGDVNRPLLHYASRQANHRHHPARCLPIPPIRFKKFRIAIRAKPAVLICPMLTPFRPSCRHVVSTKSTLVRPDKTKLGGHLGSHFEAARADSGPDRDDQILGLAAEPPTHRVHGFRRDLGNHAAPSGVNRGHRAIFRVGDQNRKTIGRSNRQTDARHDSRSAHRPRPEARRFHHQNPVRVNLLGRRQAGWYSRPSGAQPGAEPVLEPTANRRALPLEKHRRCRAGTKLIVTRLDTSAVVTR